MLDRPSDKILSNLARLNGLVEFKIFLEYLQENLNKLDRDNRRLSGEVLHRSQGAALTLDAILTSSKDASTILSRKQQQ
jgi:hypothetical protein